MEHKHIGKVSVISSYMKQGTSVSLPKATPSVGACLVVTLDIHLKGEITHTVSPNLMLILSNYRVVLHSLYESLVLSDL